MTSYTSQVTKVYFVELHVKITDVNSKHKILITTYENVKDFFCQKTAKKFSDIMEKNWKKDTE